MSAPMSYAFLGPFGTFCHQAVAQVAPADAELVPCAGERVAMDATRDRRTERTVVPIENSVEGGVTATLDSLAWGKRLQIVQEIIVPVAFTLAVRPGTRLEDIKQVGTHSHAWAQCRNWAADTLPDAHHTPTTSTAEAARLLAEGPQSFQACLSSAAAVQMYGLTPLISDVADNKGAVTRFVVLSLPGHVPDATGADKTTIQVRLRENHAGALLQMLEQFRARGVDLTRIESRPVAGQPGSYGFSIDLAGHVREERVQAALNGVYRTCADVRFLGSYPRADERCNEVEAGTEDADFVAAREWVQALLD
ncbi:MAG: prephenate dehydratase [Actinomycetaceae bacterium]|nr:prephenate dehydratase [Actinomycetaceae bacterium]MDU0970767.1 prephenate dehydratase [Actinomycetaceae bacterium]